MGLLTAQPRVYAMPNWAREITCSMADLTVCGHPGRRSILSGFFCFSMLPRERLQTSIRAYRERLWERSDKAKESLDPHTAQAMPDKRKHRGPHPDDSRLFAPDQITAIRQAAAEYAWLLTHGYAYKSTLKLVGDRHGLDARQRLAVLRTACSDQVLENRKAREVPLVGCSGQAMGIDGYNVLITVESAMSGGVVLIGRDGCCRDLASLHGTYRKVEETVPAVALIAEHVVALGVQRVDGYLDKPVSNSGRLKVLMADLLEARGWLDLFNIELVDSPD